MNDNSGTKPLHGHDFLGAGHDDNARRTRWVVVLTAVMMVVEIAGGGVTGSMALLADGFHMATHAGALAMSAAAYAFATRHAANPRFSFGTGKVGDLAGFASAITLALFALGIAYESVERMIRPGPIAYAEALWVAVLGLVVNLASAGLLGGGHGHDHDHGHGHHHHTDNNLRSAYVHVLADALTSVLAIAALVAGQQFGLAWLDSVVGLLGAAVILRWSWTLIRDTAAVLLDTVDPQLEQAVRERVETGGVRIIDLHVWRVGPTARAAIVSVTGPADLELIRRRLGHLPGLAHVTVECWGEEAEA